MLPCYLCLDAGVREHNRVLGVHQIMLIFRMIKPAFEVLCNYELGLMVSPVIQSNPLLRQMCFHLSLQYTTAFIAVFKMQCFIDLDSEFVFKPLTL